MKVPYDEALDDDDRMLRSLVSREVLAFDTPAIVNTLQKAIDYAFLPDIHHAAWKLHLQCLVRGNQSLGFQKKVSRLLDTVWSNFNASEFLSKRMKRWRPAVSDTGKNWWDFCGPFAINLCRHELEGAPQCVIAAYIKTILNGWSCTRRLQLNLGQCVFGCGINQDCIEHYLECHNVEAIWNRISTCEWGPFENRLAIGCASLSERISKVYFLYGIYCTYNLKKHRAVHGSGVAECSNIVMGKITYALGRSSSNMRRL